ncbi:MAG: hypothetical protein JNL32_12430, partial [Candidatus Kapabacteria bacterium]|nr:hypothetical protein [Candidatus Kapabacteria bacterium]
EQTIQVIDVIDISTEAPRFTSINQKMTVIPQVKNRSNGQVPTGLKFVITNLNTFRFDFDNGFPDSLGFENGVVTFDSTNGKIEWTPVVEGYIYASGYIEKDGLMISGGQFGFYTHAIDFTKRDTSEVMFSNYPTTSLKPGEAWSFKPSVANRYTGVELNATYKLAAGAPQGLTYDSTTKTFSWTAPQKGMYSVFIDAIAENGSTVNMPFMLLVADHISPTISSGNFSLLPWNWAHVGDSYDSTFNYFGFHNKYMVATLDSLQGTDEFDIDDVRYKLEAGAPGMTLDSVTGKVSWTPTQQGVWDVVVKAYHTTRGGVARVTLSFFAFDMEPEAVGLLVRGRRSGTTSVKEEPLVTSMTNMTVAPMPVADAATITLKEQRTDIPVLLRITDMNGTTVYQSLEQPLSGGRYQINLDRLAQGTYLLSAEQANKRSATPLVIVR